MSDPAIPLQTAIYQRLIDELSVPVYDDVPMDTPYPYVTIDSEMSNNTSPIWGRKREQRFLYLSVWSNYPGQIEVKRIIGEIVAALDERPLALTSHIPLEVEPGQAAFIARGGEPLQVSILPPGQTPGRAVSVRVERTSTNREPDGVTYMGSVTVRIITQH